MPLYEYQCAACEHRFERIPRFADPHIDRCPSCGQGPVHKMLSAPAVHFKGTGWYVTDYAKKSGAAAAKTDAGPGDSPTPAAETESAGDTKPAASAESKPAQESSK
jgi:putative FmdB family regulatory protein